MELLPDIIYKNSGFAQAFLQENFKFGPGERYQGFSLQLPLLLLPLIQSFFFKEYSYNRDSVAVSGFKQGKIVFTLLYKIITIYVQLILINVWGLGFESPL